MEILGKSYFRNFLLLSFTICLFLNNQNVFSQKLSHQKFYASINQIQSIENDYPELHLPYDNQPGPIDPTKILKATEIFIAIGEKIYDIIKKGQPVINTNYEPIAVLPKDLATSKYPGLEMTRWRGPNGKKYALQLKNSAGAQVVYLEFLVMWNYGGQYMDHGQYLSGVQIVPTTIKAAWGYTFSLTSKVDDVFNYGTLVEPIAAVTLRLNYKVENVMKKSENNIVFVVDGAGGFKTF
jgi:hypothetical protein